MPVYIDTSALAKRYVNEVNSEAFDQFLAGCALDCIVTPLGQIELQSLLQRLLRERRIDLTYLTQAQAAFQDDIHTSRWSLRPFEASAFEAAHHLVQRSEAPLATLDALHLASAHAFGCTELATADRQLARAARNSGLTVHDFAL